MTGPRNDSAHEAPRHSGEGPLAGPPEPSAAAPEGSPVRGAILGGGPRPEGVEGAGGAQLALRWPFGGTLALAVAILLMMSGGLEAIARSPWGRSHLPIGSYGTASRYFDYQMERLREFVAHEGPPDCIFLGASPVFRGIDPSVVAQAYRAQTGHTIRCFNFGIRGLDPANAAVLGGIIRQDYKPPLLIFGLDIPNLAGRTAEGLRDRFIEAEWVRYRLGEFTLESWLIEHSNAMRVYMRYRNWVLPGYSTEENRKTDNSLSAAIRPDGHAVFLARATDLADVPSTQSEEARFYDLLNDYEIDRQQLQGVERLLQVEPGYEVVLLEMPVHPSFLRYYGDGAADYRLGLTTARDAAARAGVPFWDTTLLRIIPDDGWANRSHLNAAGARVFSQWLGTRLGQAVVDGQLTDPAALRREAAETP